MEAHADEIVQQTLYDETFVELKRGDLVKGKVVKIDPDAVLVDVGGKTEGTIPLEELSLDRVEHPEKAVKVGDEVEVCVLEEGEDGSLRLSRRRAELERTWSRIKEAFKKGETVHGTVVEQVRGGLVVDLGVRGFIPASHVGKQSPKNFDEFVGETLPLKILEIDPQRGRVVLSHRNAAKEEAKKRKESFWNDVYEGQLRSGTVVRFANFGAFVDLGGIDGLIHLSELSWRRAKHPSEVAKIGDKIEVMVLGFDRGKERISLSLRRAQPDPWTALPNHLKTDAEIEGTVTKVAKRYLFVEVAPGVEGVLPVSETSGTKLSEGDKVKARIVDLRPDARRMTLSLRDAKPAKIDEDNYRNYLTSGDDRPLTVKDILGDQLPSEMGGPGK